MQQSNTKCIGDLLRKMVKEEHWDEGLMKVRIFATWDELLCGMTIPPMPLEEAAAQTTMKKFEGRVLTCRMRSSVMRTQLQFQAVSLRRQINERLGGQYVERIVLI
ncbi:MAG: DUF721 domain-containing protein [Bacteroidales bacterium]|nr:DUF721 domain-containing protein [Bacteroidales bacterium]